MTPRIVHWMCAEGHIGDADDLPRLCPGYVNGRPCGAPCHETDARGHRKAAA